jgi:hypothetical protein
MNQGTKALTQWGLRYNKNGYIKSNILKEDQQFFEEHADHIKQKQSIYSINQPSTLIVLETLN